jgi:hypothetical protein
VLLCVPGASHAVNAATTRIGKAARIKGDGVDAINQATRFHDVNDQQAAPACAQHDCGCACLLQVLLQPCLEVGVRQEVRAKAVPTAAAAAAASARDLEERRA